MAAIGFGSDGKLERHCDKKRSRATPNLHTTLTLDGHARPCRNGRDHEVLTMTDGAAFPAVNTDNTGYKLTTTGLWKLPL